MSFNDPLSNLSLNHFTSAAIFTSLCLCLSFLVGFMFSNFCFGEGHHRTRLKSLFSMPIDDVSGRTSLQMAIIQISGVLWSPPHLFVYFCVLSFFPFSFWNDPGTLQLGTCTYLFYFWGVGHLIYSIKLWTYYWDFLNSFLSSVYYYCWTLLLEFVQIILSNTSAVTELSLSRHLCNCSLKECPAVMLQWLNCFCPMWKVDLLTLFP